MQLNIWCAGFQEIHISNINPDFPRIITFWVTLLGKKIWLDGYLYRVPNNSHSIAFAAYQEMPEKFSMHLKTSQLGLLHVGPLQTLYVWWQ